MNHSASAIISEEEFLELPTTTDKVELVDGEIIESPSPSFGHQRMLLRLVRALDDWRAQSEQPATVVMAPMDVRFAPGRILQPDACLSFAPAPDDKTAILERVPELCVEVLSSRRSYDRLTKRLIYAEAGVRELWTVSTDGAAERWSGESLSERTLFEDVLTSELLPGFAFDLKSSSRT
ncbi:MAG: Uma2 family endonuclease [Myxococcota bacterium]